jgi:hypothetical protein
LAGSRCQLDELIVKHIRYIDPFHTRIRDGPIREIGKS